MKKVYTLCLAILLSGGMSAFAINNPDAAKKLRLTSKYGVSVPGMAQFNAAQRQMQKLSMNNSKVQMAGKILTKAEENAPAQTLDGTSFGWLVGTDGSQWYYTQQDELVNGDYASAVITIYNDNNKQVGQFKVDVPEGKVCNQLQVYGTVTSKFFDKSSSKVALVQMHFAGNKDNDYKSVYCTRAYDINTSEVKFETSATGVFFDGSEGFNTYQRLLLLDQQTVSDGEDSENAKTQLTVDVYAPATWGHDQCYSEHQFTFDGVKVENLCGSYINCFLVDGKPYFVTAEYEQKWDNDPVKEDYSDYTQVAGNHMIVTTYDRYFNQVESFKVPVDPVGDNAANEWRQGGIGLMSDNDVSKDYFAKDGKLKYVVSFMDYDHTKDSYSYDFDVYDAENGKVKAVCEDVISDGWWTLSSVRGKEDQMAFARTNGDAEEIVTVNLPSCETVATIPAQLENMRISTNMDRYPSTKNKYGYQYVLSMGQSLDNGGEDVIAPIGWFNPDLSLDHFDYFNMGTDGILFTPLLNGQTMNPYLFDSDDAMEYIYIAKLQDATTKKINNVLQIAKAQEDGNAKVIYSYEGEGDKAFYSASLLGMANGKNQLAVIYNVNNGSSYNMNFYDLPLNKFAAGGEGTAASPYLVSTVGDLQQMAFNRNKYFKLANDIDYSTAPSYWTPIDQFSGSLDGDNHTISNFAICNDGYRAGMFSNTAENATIKNLTFMNPTMELTGNNSYAGFIAAEGLKTTIDNVHIYGAKVESNEDVDATFGGLMGGTYDYGTISNCSFNGTVNLPGSSRVGGLAGLARTSSKINTSLVDMDATAAGGLGGIVSESGTDNTITDCEVRGNLTANNTIGGIAATSSRALIYRCITRANITATQPSRWGGFVAGGIVGDLEGDYTGSDDKVLTNCLADVNIKAENTNESISGYPETVHQIVGKTSANDVIEEGEEVIPEKGLADNYTTTDKGSDATSQDGAYKAVKDMSKNFFAGLGYEYDETKAWKESYVDDVPVLYFDEIGKALQVSQKSILVALENTVTVDVLAYGRPDMEELTVKSSNPRIADVTLGESEAGKATLIVTGNMLGRATITVTLGDLTTKFTVQVAPSTGIDNVTENEAMELHISGGNVVAEGAQSIKVYNMGGQLSAQGKGSVLNIAQLTKGIYVVVAADASGNKVTRKVVLK